MPVRERAEEHLSRRVLGSVFFRHGQIDPSCVIDQKEFELVMSFVEEMYCAVIDLIDWNRIVLEAASRCSRLQEEDPDHLKGKKETEAAHEFAGEKMGVTFCPDCLHQQLLTYEKDDPSAEIDRPDGPPARFHITEELTREFANYLIHRKAAFDQHRKENPDGDR